MAAPSRSVGISGVAVLFASLGAYFVYAGIKNVGKEGGKFDPLGGLRDILKGTTPGSRTSGEPFQPGEITFSGPDTPISASTTGAGSVGQPTAPIPMSETALVPGTLIRMWKGMVPATTRLINDARAAGLNINGFGWRSTERQIQLRMQNGCPDVYNAPSSSCRVPTARPGQSQHERGLAIDFTTGGGIITKNSRVFTWLSQHAAEYGFHNLPSEPWHWSTTGH